MAVKKHDRMHQPLAIGGEAFVCGAKKAFAGSALVPFVPFAAVADWLGAPYGVEAVRQAVAATPFLAEHVLELDGCGPALSPIGVALVVFEVQPPAPMALRARAARMLLHWWSGRAANIRSLTRAFS